MFIKRALTLILETLEAVLYKGIADYSFVCRVNGFLLDGIDNIVIGNKEVKIYDPKQISNLPGINDAFHKTITKEFANKLVIIGTEQGSQAIAQEKFYHNSELALSILRLYSCALYSSAIHDINIQLIPDCDRSHNHSGCFFWSNTEESLTTLTGYLDLKQDFKINPKLIEELNSNYFFNEVSSIIEKKDKNELENTVVKSLFWIGEAQKDQSYASAWVNLWSCIECFFVFGECKVTERNAQGVASILVYGGYSHKLYNDYHTLKTKIKKYYGLRSKIVHHAEYSHINEELLEELSFMVAWVVITMISLVDRGYTSFADVQMKIDRLDKL